MRILEFAKKFETPSPQHPMEDLVAEMAVDRDGLEESHVATGEDLFAYLTKHSRGNESAVREARRRGSARMA